MQIFILNNRNQLHKFDTQADDGIYIRYWTTTKAYTFYNKRTLVVDEFVHVAFDEYNSFSPMWAYDEKEANIESWKSNLVPSSDTPQESQERMR